MISNYLTWLPPSVESASSMIQFTGLPVTITRSHIGSVSFPLCALARFSLNGNPNKD
jgi:hypothetical protein